MNTSKETSFLKKTLTGCYQNYGVFSSFFSCKGLIPGPPSYFTAFPNVYVAACGTQFYKQCFPSGSIHLGLCSIAIQWLSKIPCSITGGLYHHQSQNREERELFSKQAAADWETFLLMRAKELSPGMLEVWRCGSSAISGLDKSFSRPGYSPGRGLYLVIFGRARHQLRQRGRVG